MIDKKRFLEKVGLVVVIISLFEATVLEISGKTDDISVLLVIILFAVGMLVYLVPEEFLKKTKVKK